MTRQSYRADRFDYTVASTAGTPDVSATPLARYIQHGVRQSPENFHAILGALDVKNEI